MLNLTRTTTGPSRGSPVVVRVNCDQRRPGPVPALSMPDRVIRTTSPTDVTDHVIGTRSGGSGANRAGHQQQQPK